MLRLGWLGVVLLVVVGSGAVAEEDAVCLDCHLDEELQRESDWRPGTSVFVDPDLLANSVHEGMACVDCHLDATEDHGERLPTLACVDCHDEATDLFEAGQHGQALASGAELAPTCGSCHGGHDIQYIDDHDIRRNSSNTFRIYCRTVIK